MSTFPRSTCGGTLTASARLYGLPPTVEGAEPHELVCHPAIPRCNFVRTHNSAPDSEPLGVGSQEPADAAKSCGTKSSPAQARRQRKWLTQCRTVGRKVAHKPHCRVHDRDGDVC